MCVLPTGGEVQERPFQEIAMRDGRFAIAMLAAACAGAQTLPRTPDGQPDIQGMYARNGVVGLEANPPENPIDPGEKNPLSVSARADGLGPYPKIFQQGGGLIRQGRQQRRTGIVDPEDKKLPWRPEEEAKRRD